MAARAGTATTAAIGATVLFAPAAQADTFQVTSTDDELSDSPGSVECDADCTLREALYEANNESAGADTITFASNVTGTITVDDSYQEFYAEEAVTIQGPGADLLAISGGGDRRVFYTNPDEEGDRGDPVTVSGLTLTEGDTDFPDGGGGGAVDARYAALTLSEVAVTDNDASFGGGVWAADTSLSVLSSVMTGNSAGSDGGAIYRDENRYGPEVIRDSVFMNNTAGELDSPSDTEGGAIALYDTYYDPVLIDNVVVAANTAGGFGGGIQLYDWSEDGPITISDSTITGNETAISGGGIGIYVNDAPGPAPPPVTIQNTTVSENVAADGGGGVYFRNLDGGTGLVQNTTIVGNAAANGGGVYIGDGSDVNGPVELSSTIVANNTASDSGPDLDQAESEEDFELEFSLVEDSAGADISELSATNIFGQDPQLGPLANNSGPTQTHLPAATSPAIDAGVANGLANDQRGQPRTFDTAAVDNGAGSDGTDIGSVELQPGEGGLPGNAECKGVTVQKIVGTSGDDTLTGTDDRELITGRGGKDAIRALDGKDCANGNSGNDTVHGGRESDQVKGGGGKDKVKGGGDGDRVKGQAGKDRVGGGGGDDKVTGGAGKDRVKGGGGVDKLKGQGGKDRLKAVDGTQDKVNCGGGKDRATVDKKDRVSDNCEKVIEKG